jgi:tetratricopeptide (TPR) repeat protein
VAAVEAKGFLLWQLGRRAEGLEDLRSALRLAPRREAALTYGGVLSAAMGHSEEAAGYWRRAVAISPAAATYRHRLAQLLADRGEWKEALEQSAAAVRLNPLHREARELHARCQAKANGR